ncbi:MAG: ATP phosphoribosyltransferase regulatory subunit [Betaproteobacteria bacterium]
MRKWLLPEAIVDVLPPEAARVEALRRVLLDHVRGRGFRLVQPPLVEYLESLLTGTGRDLDLLTFKTVDPSSGRLLGIRADTTPQVARIDAHVLNESGITRLCYAGSVVRTSVTSPGDTREALQLGAELYGHAGIAADIEVMGLLLSVLNAARVGALHLDLGHVGVYRALARVAGLTGSGEGDDVELFTALRDKDAPLVHDLTAALPAEPRKALRALATLYGPADATLAAARQALPPLPDVTAALDCLAALAAAANVDAIHIDLADLRGYHYYNGATFSVFAERGSGAVVDCGRGGRYDGVGRAFGRARPATGFSLDLRRLAELAPIVADTAIITAPAGNDAALAAAIVALRERGEAVVIALPDEVVNQGRRLERRGNEWQLVER